MADLRIITSGSDLRRFELRPEMLSRGVEELNRVTLRPVATLSAAWEGRDRSSSFGTRSWAKKRSNSTGMLQQDGSLWQQQRSKKEVWAGSVGRQCMAVGVVVRKWLTTLSLNPPHPTGRTPPSESLPPARLECVARERPKLRHVEGLRRCRDGQCGRAHDQTLRGVQQDRSGRETHR